MFLWSAGLLPGRDLGKLGGHVALDPPAERIPKVAVNDIYYFACLTS